MSIILDFNLDHATALEDLRISCLPLVMETSGVWGSRDITVRSQVSRDFIERTMVAEHQIRLQDIRAKVVKALVDVVFIAKDR